MSPAGFVKLTSTAPGASRSTMRAMSRITGIVRSALAKPPTPVVSCPIRPKSRARQLVAMPRRLAADAQLGDDEVGAADRLDRLEPQRTTISDPGRLAHAAREARDDLEALAVGIEQVQLAHGQRGRAAGSGRRPARACTSSRHRQRSP